MSVVLLTPTYQRIFWALTALGGPIVLSLCCLKVRLPWDPPPTPFLYFRNKDVTANASMCDLLASGRSLVASILNRAPPPDEQRNAIWTKSCEEQQKGWLSEWMTVLDLDALFGEGQWSPVVRFALWQKGKWRMIDDASEVRNLTFAASEHIYTTSPSAAAALVRTFRKYLGRWRGWRVPTWG